MIFATLATLLIITYQDIRYRGVSWYLFLLLGILLWNESRLDFHCINLNSLILVMVYMLLTLIISIREKKWTNILKQHIGPGDWLLLLCLACFFPPKAFLCFYLMSLLIITLGSLAYQSYQKTKSYTIPLAGLQAFLLAAYLLCQFNGWTLGIEELISKT